jgi:hypothetical protein
VTGEWTRLHSGELCDLHASSHVIRARSEMGGECDTYGGGERCVQDFGGET